MFASVCAGSRDVRLCDMHCRGGLKDDAAPVLLPFVLRTLFALVKWRCEHGQSKHSRGMNVVLAMTCSEEG